MDIELIKELIKKQVCFSQLTNEEIEELTSLFAEVRFKAGETIVREGDLVDSVFLIVSGTVDVCHIMLDDNIQKINTVATLGPGDAIGLNESGFYSLSGVRTATVIAETDIELLQLSVAAFHGFALVHPHVIQEMRKYVKKILPTPS